MSVISKYGIGKRLIKRWCKINRKIKQMGCPVDLPKIRPYHDGAYEIMELVGSYQMSNPYFWLFTFKARMPFTGEDCFYSMEFSRQTVFLPVVEGKLMLKNYFLPSLGYWNFWVPTVISSLPENEVVLKYEESPKNLLIRDLMNINELTFREDVADSMEVLFLGKSAKDRGMSVVLNNYFLVKLSNVDFQFIGGRRRKEHWQLFDLNEVEDIALDHEKAWCNKSNTMLNFLNLRLKREEVTLSDLSRV